VAFLTVGVKTKGNNISASDGKGWN